jgi:hypothetical protein
MRIAYTLLAATPLLALAACNSDNSTPAPVELPISTEPALPANPWTIRYSPGMPAEPAIAADGAITINFPMGGACPQPVSNNLTNAPGPCNHVDYVTRTPIALNMSITVNYTVAGDCVLGFDTEMGNTAGDPPQLTLLLEHTGDAALTVFSYRWYSSIRGPMTAGTHTLTVPLTIAHWSDVQGPPPGTNAQFVDTLANLAQVGFVLGGGNAAGHGLYCKTGTGTLTINSFTSP